MSFIKVTPDNFEHSTLVTHPKRNFSSSSAGITGSVSIFARNSDIERELDSTRIEDIDFDDATIMNIDTIGARAIAGGATNVHDMMQQYMTHAHSLATVDAKTQKLEIKRIVPSVVHSSCSIVKSIITKSLFPWYRSSQTNCNFAYTNYHSLNFFTSSTVPDNSVLLYPNSASVVQDAPAQTYVSGAYVVSSAFTFEFYINPRYSTDAAFDGFKAGTIFHLSSTYAVSLVTGSSKDIEGRPDGFRLLLQLSHSTDTSPSTIELASSNNMRTYPNDLIFSSADNLLKRNHWHHVAIRWGSNATNGGSGSFIIDGVEDPRSSFNVPSSSIAPLAYADVASKNPAVLCVGNYYQGSNSSTDSQALFFNASSATRDGLTEMTSLTADPAIFSFNHPLNAEIHELRIFDKFRTLNDILSGSLYGLPEIDSSLKFYVPPFFRKSGPTLSSVAGVGGVLVTPFLESDDQLITPYNVEMGFRTGGHMLNVENFVFDFASLKYPRLINLTGSVQLTSVSDQSSTNDYLYSLPAIRKRNLSILPCDNGLFIPDFKLLNDGTAKLVPMENDLFDRYVDDHGTLDLSLISLNNLIPKQVMNSTSSIEHEGFEDLIAGPVPENPKAALNGAYNWSIFQRLRDVASDQIVMFNVSNLFYGKRILPGSFRMIDSSLTGSSGKFGMALRDNGNGGLYRADAFTKHASWNNVGNIFYSEGLVLVKSPNIPLFGKDQFVVDFKGEQNIYTLKFIIPVQSSEFNSSSNPTFMNLSASLNANDAESSFVYITGLNFHDDNLNVIMKTSFAQPILKRTTERIVIRPRIDF